MSQDKTIKSHMIKLLEDNIDTDQMVPARFLRTVSSTGLSKVLFYDRIYPMTSLSTSDVLGHPFHKENKFPLDPRCYKGETILVAGQNFGCGSSREHAAWALHEFGIRVILAPSFGDIFKNNALKNGLLAIEIDHEFHLQLREIDGPIAIDLIRMEINTPKTIFSFSLDPFARYCILRGISQFDYLFENLSQAERFFSLHRERFCPVTQDL